MPPVAFDSRCLTVGGRRRWIVGGTIDYARIPADDWARRVALARQAGLNCVVVPLVWAMHEPMPGRFEFDDELDVARFVRLVGDAGMMVVLRPGPFIGGGWDRGGMPSWLDAGADDEGRALTLRSGAPKFLEACARWIGAVAQRLKGLQATAAGDGGPIVAVQNEHRWFCGDEATGAAYLGELARYLRENGFNVPFLNTNNLFYAPESEIDAWNGHDAMLRVMRQLRAVRPSQPAIAMDFEIGQPLSWTDDEPTGLEPDEAVHMLAQTMAAGAQFSLGPFDAGVNHGFLGGRRAFTRDGYNAQRADHGGPVGPGGAKTPLYNAVKRISTFAASFGRVLSGLDASSPGVVVDPSGEQDGAVVHVPGAHGSVAFVFRSPRRKPKGRFVADLALSDGRSLPVDLSGQPVVWCLFDALLSERARLDYCNLSAFAVVGSALVCYGPPGAEAIVSINGAEIRTGVPAGKTPVVFEHEDATVVVCSEDQVDAAVATSDAVHIGVEGLGDDGEPVPHPNHRKRLVVRRDGSVETENEPAPKRLPNRPQLRDWTLATQDAYIDGTSERFAVIPGPATLESLGADYGYGWLRMTLSAGSARKPKVLLPEAADRVHVYAEGELVEVAGLCPGATEAPFQLPLRKGKNTVIALVDNMGRPTGGVSDAQKKGLHGPVWEVKAFRTTKPRLETAEPLAPLAFRSPITRLHPDDQTDARRITWTFTHRKKSPIAMCVGELPVGTQALLVVNDEPIAFIDDGVWARFVLGESALRRGGNTVQLAVLGDAGALLEPFASATAFYECVTDVMEKAEWSFAKWESPRDDAFEEVSKTKSANLRGRPLWRRALFSIREASAPLMLEPVGMTKGQVFVNGRNAGRYFVADRGGRKVDAQTAYELPRAWLNEHADNELILFDEHGADPAKVRLSWLKSG